MTQSPEVDGPHRLPRSDQERCVVKGVRIDASGQRDAIRDGKRRGVVLHLRGIAGPGVLIDNAAARTLARGISDQDDQEDKNKDGGQHRDKEQEKRDTDGQGPIDPDIVREPKPGKRGQ